MIIPSIDIMDGKAVQLVNGNENDIRAKFEDPVGLSEKFNLFGEVAIIDLDAAFGKNNNNDLIEQICIRADCRVGGGIRSIERGDQILSMGAKKIIIGTKAEPDFLSSFNKDRVIVAIDMKGEKVATNGWKQTIEKSPLEQAILLQDYCREFLFTDVQKEGRMSGINLDMAKTIKSAIENQLTYAGGISSVEDIQKLENEGINSQIGMAIYTGAFSLVDAFVSVLDFNKNDGLIPTIVQDERTGLVLMQAYSSEESLRYSLSDNNKERLATYYSRSRGELWTKGKGSGNKQRLIKARFDCDRDTLLFKVNQKGHACHTGNKTCFIEDTFNLKVLEQVIAERKKKPTSNSFTAKLFEEDSLLERKLLEEIGELIEHTSKENLVWEASDVIYFLLVYLTKHGVSLGEVENELWRRRK